MSTNKKLPDWRCGVLIAVPETLQSTTSLPSGWLPDVQWETTPTAQARQWVSRLEEVSVHTDAGVCIFVAQPLPKWASKIHTATLEWQRQWRKAPWPVRCITVNSLAEAGWYAQALARPNLLNTMSLDTRLAALQRRLHGHGNLQRLWWGYRACNTSSATAMAGPNREHRYLSLKKAIHALLHTQAGITDSLLLTDAQGHLSSIDYAAFMARRSALPKGIYFDFCAGQSMLG